MASASHSVYGIAEVKEHDALTDERNTPDALGYNCGPGIIGPEGKERCTEVEECDGLEKPPHWHEADVESWHLHVVEPIFQLLHHGLGEIEVEVGYKVGPCQQTSEAFADVEHGKGIIVHHEPVAEHYLLNEDGYPCHLTRVLLKLLNSGVGCPICCANTLHISLI